MRRNSFKVRPPQVSPKHFPETRAATTTFGRIFRRLWLSQGKSQSLCSLPKIAQRPRKLTPPSVIEFFCISDTADSRAVTR